MLYIRIHLALGGSHSMRYKSLLTVTRDEFDGIIVLPFECSEISKEYEIVRSIRHKMFYLDDIPIAVSKPSRNLSFFYLMPNQYLSRQRS